MTSYGTMVKWGIHAIDDAVLSDKNYLKYHY